MRVWLRLAAVFLLGVWLGGAGFLFLYGHDMEQLMRDNRSANYLIEQLYEDIEHLKDSQRMEKNRPKTVVEEIKVTILEPKPDPFLEKEIIRTVEKDLAPLKGLRTETILEMHTVLHDLIKRREYSVSGKIAEVRLRTVLISRRLEVFVTVTVKARTFG
jgi:hypothetical protein